MPFSAFTVVVSPNAPVGAGGGASWTLEVEVVSARGITGDPVLGRSLSPRVCMLLDGVCELVRGRGEDKKGLLGGGGGDTVKGYAMMLSGTGTTGVQGNCWGLWDYEQLELPEAESGI